MLGMEELLKGTRTDGIQHGDLDAIANFVYDFVDTCNNVCNYSHGSGFNCIKVHLLKHMVSHDIKRLGIPANFSEMPGETQFKENMKNPGSTSCKQADLFDKDLYQRRHEHLIVKRYCQTISRINLDESNKSKPSLPNNIHTGEGVTKVHLTENEIGSDRIGTPYSHLYTLLLAKNASHLRDDIPLKPTIIYTGKKNRKIQISHVLLQY